MNNNFTQHHHWGIIDHGCRMLMWHQRLSDEFLWEFTQPEDVLEEMFGLDVVNYWLKHQGGFLLTDKPDPVPKFHDIEVWAYHSSPKMLSWISLKLR